MKKVLFVAIVFALFTSCSKDEITDDRLNGNWQLSDVQCFCGFDPDINFNDFTLNFNESSKILILDNPTEGYFYIAESGSYSYSLQDGQILKIEGAQAFQYEITNNILTLILIDNPQIADDELTLIYKRS